jgi:hypothetical protein
MHKLTLAAVVVALLALTAVAFAATPRNGKFQGDAITLRVKKHRIVEVIGKSSISCTSATLDLKKHIAVKHGKFHGHGAVGGGTLSLSGRFKTKKLVKGTYKFVKGSCSTGKKHFDAAIGDAPD